MRSCAYIFGFMLLVMPSLTRALELNVGATIGGSWMNQEYEFTEDFPYSSFADDGIPGFVVGAFLSVRLHRQFSVVVETLYIRKGYESTFVATLSNGGLLGEQTEVYAAHYLSVPVTLRFELESKPVTPYFFGGVGTEILVSGGDTHTFDWFNSLALSGQLGMGLTWRRFGFDIRYLRDLTNNVDPTVWVDSVTNDGVVAMLTFAVWQRPAPEH